MIGRVIGSYQIVDKLGEGGMGSVFKAVDLMLDREVAVKVLRPELTGQPDIVERFRSEAITLAKLHHPNIATLYSLSRDAGEMMMVMEYVDGVTLERLLGQFGAIAPGTAVSWCCQVLDAMQYAHKKGVIHRDIKPANLMVTGEGAIKVTDFGIARVLGESRRTRTGHIIGTIAYMAPEQIRGQDIDARTDLYALGSVLFELLTGHQPFEAEDDFALMTAQVTQPAPLAQAVVAGIPDWLDSAMQRVLSKAPADRFQTAGEFRAVLADGLQSLPLPADSRLIDAVARPATAGDAAAPPRSVVPPTRLAGAPAVPPTRLAIKETRLASDGKPAPQASGAQGAAPPAAARPGLAVLGQLNWRHYAGAGAVVVMLAALAAAWLRPASPPVSPAGQPPPSQQAAAPDASKPAPAVTPRAIEAERPRVEQPPPSTQAPIIMPPAQPERSQPVPVPERRRPPSTTPQGGPPAPPPAPPIPKETAAPPVVAQPPPAEVPRPATETRAADRLPDASYDRVAWVIAEGDAKDEIEVAIQFRRDTVEIFPLDEETKGKTFSYSSIVGMTYSQVEPSRWKKLIRMKSSHWLTVKTRSETAELHLDSRNYKTIIEAFEARTGLKVQR